MNIDAIVYCIGKAGELDTPSQIKPHCIHDATEQLYALVENQIKGRCKDCEHHSTDLTSLHCDKINHYTKDYFYCSYFTKREA